MQLENLKIQANEKYSLDFMKYFPKKNHGENKIIFYSLHDVVLLPNDRKFVPLELKFSVDENMILQIGNNEDIARHNGIFTLPQTIMNTQTDYVSITLWNTTSAKYNINKGDVIACGYMTASPVLYDLQRVKKI